MNSRDSKEIEAKLIVCSLEPVAILDRIADLPSVANYELIPAGIQNIRDIYFDMRKGDLQGARLALRLREIDSKYWLTFKGPGRATDSGGMVRDEIEKEWSLDALSRVISEMSERGVKIHEPTQRSETDDPAEVLSSAGLKVVQERQTRRVVRNVVLEENAEKEVLAEMAIDSVVYRFRDREFRLHEVEVELKGKGDGTVMHEVVSGLKSMWRLELRTWPHSKLATGKAIEQLLEAGGLQGMIDEHDNLKQDAYSKIDDYLRTHFS